MYACMYSATYIHSTVRTPDMRSLEPGNDGYTSQSSDRRGNSHSSPLEQRQLLDSPRFGIPSGLLPGKRYTDVQSKEYRRKT